MNLFLPRYPMRKHWQQVSDCLLEQTPEQTPTQVTLNYAHETTMMKLVNMANPYGCRPYCSAYKPIVLRDAYSHNLRLHCCDYESDPIMQEMTSRSIVWLLSNNNFSEVSEVPQLRAGETKRKGWSAVSAIRRWTTLEDYIRFLSSLNHTNLEPPFLY